MGTTTGMTTTGDCREVVLGLRFEHDGDGSDAFDVRGGHNTKLIPNSAVPPPGGVLLRTHRNGNNNNNGNACRDKQFTDSAKTKTHNTNSKHNAQTSRTVSHRGDDDELPRIERQFLVAGAGVRRDGFDEGQWGCFNRRPGAHACHRRG